MPFYALRNLCPGWSSGPNISQRANKALRTPCLNGALSERCWSLPGVLPEWSISNGAQIETLWIAHKVRASVRSEGSLVGFTQNVPRRMFTQNVHAECSLGTFTRNVYQVNRRRYVRCATFWFKCLKKFDVYNLNPCSLLGRVPYPHKFFRSKAVY